MRLAIGVVVALAAVPAHGQTGSQTGGGQTGSQTVSTFACGAFRTESWRTAKGSHWTIARASEKNIESAVLKRGPRFECIGGAALAVEFVPANGQPFLDLYFTDGTNIGYGGQHLERNGRFVVPVQARPRIPADFRGSFDYHCRFELPADPITPELRQFCG